MSEKSNQPSLKDLDERLRKARAASGLDGRKDGGTTDGEARGRGLGMAIRIGVELVAALAISVAIGWLLDRWLGTKPWLMIVFFVLGSLAGMMNVYRTMSGIGHGVGYAPGGKRAEKQAQPGDERGDD